MNYLGQWLMDQENSDVQGLGTANTKSLENSMDLMNKTFLVEYASRNTGYLLANGDGITTAANCTKQLSYAGASFLVAQKFCGDCGY
jgi:hypothetical protein